MNVAELSALIDARPVRGFQWRVLALAAATIVLDGFDIQAVAFAAPGLSAEWGLSRSQLGPVLAAALIGMACGTFLGGLAGDRWGRRPALVVSVALFGALSLASALASSPEQLILLRLLTGLGLGAAIPNATALAVEWMPARRRSLAVTIVNVGVPLGGMLGALLASWVIPAFGWRACIAIGGILPLLLALYMLAALPESLRFLAAQPQRRDALARLLARIGAEPPGEALPNFAGATPRGPSGPSQLFAPALRVSTLALWVAFFAGMAAVYALFNYVPTLLASKGLPLTVSLRAAMVFNLFGVLGSFAGVGLVSRAGSRVSLLILAGLALVGAGELGAMVVSTEMSTLRVVVALAIAGFGLLGFQVGMFALAANVYPTACRATGIGWAAGFGRIGSILSALGGASVLALDPTYLTFCIALALAILTAAAGTAGVRGHVPAPPRREPDVLPPRPLP